MVDVGKHNIAVGIIHRTATKDKPGDPISGPYHDDSAEVYIIQSGSGVLTTGAMADKKPSPNYNMLNGPAFLPACFTHGARSRIRSRT